VVELASDRIAVAAYRKPLQVRRKQRQQQNADIEDRHRQADLEGAANDGIRRLLAPERSNEGKRNSQEECNYRRHPDQHQGDRKALGDQLQHGNSKTDGIAEIAGEDAPDKIEKLNDYRLVKPEARIDAGDICIKSAIAEHRACRISRQKPDQDESHDQDENHGRYHLQNATDYETEKWQIPAPELLLASKPARTDIMPVRTDPRYYLSSQVLEKMLLPSGICRKPCTFLFSATG